MPPTWQVVLRDQSGKVVATFDQWLEFAIERVVNDMGSYGLHLDGDDSRVALFNDDSQLEFWWTDPENSIAWRKEFEAFHEDYDRWTDAAGTRHFLSMGRGYNCLLDRTVNNSKASTLGAAKDGAAEAVLKEYVEEQVGPLAGARNRFGFSVAMDAGTGGPVDIQRAYRNLLTICQDIAAIGGGDFQIVGTHASQAGPASFELRWYLGQLGTDRRASVIFSEGFGNMQEPRLQVRRSHVRNAALVAAYGEGVARYTIWRTDAASIALTPWGRREVLVDAREVTDGNVAAVADKGDTALAENVQTVSFDFVAVQSPGCLYGRDYFLGDLVTARYMGVDYDRKVQRVSIQSGRNGVSVAVQTVAVE